MTPPDVLARVLAAALLDGDWEHTPMLTRVRDAMGIDRPWMRTLVRAARARYATPPAASLRELAGWLSTHDAFRKLVNASAVAADPAAWLPWTSRATLARASPTAA
jgi:hypothetical protein